MRKSFDRHLNIFWNYNGNPYLEDNLTRAFITTLSFLNKNEQLDFLSWFIDEKLDSDEINITFDLQNPYLDINKEIKKAKKRILIGFNPNGKTWGGQDYNILDNIESYNFQIEELNSAKYIQYLKHKLPLEISKKLEEKDSEHHLFGEKIKDIILSYLNRGGSRPDAWIFIHRNNILEIAIAIETKLWDLDPEQLANHCKECLNIPKEEVKYKQFKETFDKLKKLKTKKENTIINHFLDYMEKIGYYTNLDMITQTEFNSIFEAKEEDSKLIKKTINRKFEKYFNNFFSSKQYELLKLKYNLEDTYLNKRWITIKDIGIKGLGNIYFDTEFYKDDKIVFFIGTEIGVANSWYNKLFSENLIKSNFKSELAQLYSTSEPNFKDDIKSSFEIFLRVNQINYSQFIYLKNSNNLNIILDLKKEFPYKSNLTKIECIEILKKLKNSLNIDNNHITKLENRGKIDSIANNYNILSYLRFIDFVKLDYIVETSENEFNIKFSNILEKHLKGLKKIAELLKEK